MFFVIGYTSLNKIYIDFFCKTWYTEFAVL